MCADADGGPVFFAGLDRSGIGLMAEVLDSHPAFAITRRTNFWSFYYRRFGDLSRSENRDRCISEMMRFSRIRDLEPDAENLRRDFVEREPTYENLFAVLQEHNARRLGKRRWGDKSLNSEKYAEIILAAYPTAKMIHVVRDPRDRFVSQLTHRGSGRGTIGPGTAMWLWSYRLGRRSERRFPGRYRMVRYESFVSDPVGTLSAILDFVGEEASSTAPASLVMRSEDGNGEQTGSTPRSIVGGSIGRYVGALPDREVAFMQMALRTPMAHLGYRREPVVMSVPEAVRFAAWDVPVDMAGMASWWVAMKIRDRIGRRPSARRLD